MADKQNFEFIQGGGDGKGSSPRGRKLQIVLAGLVALTVFTVFAITALFTYVRPYEAAIKESRYGGGLSTEPQFGPGLFFTGPGVTYHRFPTTVQSLTITDNKNQKKVYDAHRVVGSLEIDSSDGAKIRIDATILYRITDPYKVLTKAGRGRIYEDNVIVPKTTQALKESLGELKAEDFYSETLRIVATKLTEERLNAAVSDFGLSIDHVLIRQYYYPVDYQKQIEERKVQDQLVFTNQSMADAATMEAKRRKMEAEGRAIMELETKRGQTEVTKIRAEADLYSRKRHAEADLLVSLAEARGTQLENDAYRNSKGSDNLVGMEMADVLDGVEVIFLQSGENGVNLLDLGETLDMFDVGAQ